MSKTKTSAKPVSKIGIIADLLRREGGATLSELVAATGWQPHTTRAALTGSRKKGHGIERGSRDGTTTWSMGTS